MSFLVFLLFLLPPSLTLRFSIPSHRPRCFLAKAYLRSSLQVTFQIFGLSSGYFSDSQRGIIGNEIRVFVKREDGEVVGERYGVSERGKIVVSITPGTYHICALYHSNPFLANLPRFVTIEMDIRENNLHIETGNLININDVLGFEERIGKIRRKVFGNIDKENDQIEEEYRVYREIRRSSQIYNTLAVIQVIVIIGIGAYNVYNFMKFLKGKAIV